METPKMVNLLNASNNESSKFAAHLVVHYLLVTKIMDNMAEEMKMIQPLSLKQKSLKQIFVITQMHIFLGHEI